MEVVTGPTEAKDMAEIRKDMESLKRKQPFLLEFERLRAAQTRQKYLALIKEGFSESQALDLCKEWRG